MIFSLAQYYFGGIGSEVLQIFGEREQLFKFATAAVGILNCPGAFQTTL